MQNLALCLCLDWPHRPRPDITGFGDVGAWMQLSPGPDTNMFRFWHVN